MIVDIGQDHCRVVPPGELAEGFARFEFFRHLYAYVEAGGRLSLSARILEIGTGEGYGADYLTLQKRYMVATDLSLQALTHAQARYPRVRFCQTLGTALPFVSQSFDAVVSFQVVEHLEDAARFVTEIRRVLKVGGLLYLTTPNRKLRLLPFQKPWNTYHVREYSGADLLQLVRRCFPTAQIYGVMTKPDWMAVERARIRQDPVRVLGRMVFGWLRSILRLRTAPVQTAPATRSVDRPSELSDFFLSADVEGALDLFIIATNMD